MAELNSVSCRREKTTASNASGLERNVLLRMMMKEDVPFHEPT